MIVLMVAIVKIGSSVQTSNVSPYFPCIAQQCMTDEYIFIYTKRNLAID